ncbi:unnamed protein product [Rotaria magnacalcarata]|uniref:Oxysterol-binding protein n=5 Tax=Rotaria magnacalcarata TaxID=392030 RepID=A0A816X3U9_9BILA|nr:unnamed protein product [Rotaria magnacalcarata]CAF2129877.1 unnamed protein product [Rotaria magnacalcarata]CAF2141743.1 unnamed protein product [Rotaria magnacalcarata]
MSYSEELYANLQKNAGRTKLPVPMLDRSQLSIKTILKQCIGKELSKITMPIAWNEPVSFLQRFAENVLYTYLLDMADACNDPVMRMQYVAAFAVSSISSNLDRLSKPFNPLLGETYEFVRDDLPFRYVSEQVSHHPPVSAFSCEPKDGSDRWRYYGSILPKATFSVRNMVVKPKGLLSLKLKRHQEVYTWSSLTCTIHNVLVGRLWFEYHGTMEIENHANKMKAVLNFKPFSRATKELHKVEGTIIDSRKHKLRGLYGFWTVGLYSIDIEVFESFLKEQKKEAKQALKHQQEPAANSSAASSSLSADSEDADEEVPDVDQDHEQLNLPPNSTTLWRIIPKLEHGAQYYSFSLFTMALNEWSEEGSKLRPSLAPTDSRFRPDIRKMEDGNIDLAGDEKNRLEEKQRAARRAMEKRREEWQPRWFRLVKHEITGDDVWVTNGKYWQRNWSNCPDIY